MSEFITNGELRMEAERLCDENERLVAENAKLRELAYILVYCMHDEDCDGCRLNGERGEIIADPLFACDGLHGLLRELGIEVDG